MLRILFLDKLIFCQKTRIVLQFCLVSQVYMFLSILSISRTSVSDCSDEVLTLKKLAFNLFTVTILHNKLS